MHDEDFKNHMKAVSKAMRQNEDDFIERIQSDDHKCEGNNLVIFITPFNKLKIWQAGKSFSQEINMCPYCGFRVAEKMSEMPSVS